LPENSFSHYSSICGTGYINQPRTLQALPEGTLRDFNHDEPRTLPAGSKSFPGNHCGCSDGALTAGVATVIHIGISTLARLLHPLAKKSQQKAHRV
jgi:hypothetical protein